MSEDVTERTRIEQIDLDALRHLAELNRVATSYYGFTGELMQVSEESLLRVLQSMALPVWPGCSNEAIYRAIEHAENLPWTRTLPVCTVVREGQEADIYIHVDDGQQVDVWYILEDGTGGDLLQRDNYVPPQLVNGVLRGRATFLIPGDLPLGYHRVYARVEGREPVSAHLYVVPNRLEPSVLSGDQRYWGVNVQAYSVMSRNSWGVGDSADLSNLIAVCAEEGADFILINPLHACETVTPIDNSPYRPVSRRWLNTMYIRPEDVPEYARLSEYKRKRIAELRASVSNTDQNAELLRDETWLAKDQALRWLFEVPRSIHRGAEFNAFCVAGGADLYRHALWSAITDVFGTSELPEEYRSAATEESKRFGEEHAELVHYYQWLQWIAAEQLQEPNRVAHRIGMPIGVMADLAVGTHPSGSDYWSSPQLFASGMYVGAPPDMYAQRGQSWTQPPWIPARLEEEGYEPFRQVIRSTLQLADALRIDHILGLFRLWWLPADGSPADGTYVYFDHEAMVGVLLLEAHRNDAVLIGEDLGTVEPWVRHYLAERGVLGTSVFWFEMDDLGMPIHTNSYRRDALATVNTHDLPPTAGYLDGVQTTIRSELDLLVDPVEVVLERDRVEQEKTVARLTEYGLLPADPTKQQIIEALHQYVSRTPSRLVAAALVDEVGEERPQNFPGTEHEYPNWRVPLGDGDGNRVWLEDLGRRATSEEGEGVFSVMRREFGRKKREILG